MEGVPDSIDTSKRASFFFFFAILSFLGTVCMCVHLLRFFKLENMSAHLNISASSPGHLCMCVCACVCSCACLPIPIQNKQNLLSKQIDLKGKEPEKGVLMSYTISDLRIPLSYEVRLAPITTYSTGDYISRIIQYSERKRHLKPFSSSIFVYIRSLYFISI